MTPVTTAEQPEATLYSMSEYVSHMLTIWKCSPLLIAVAVTTIRRLERESGPYPEMRSSRRSVTFDWTVPDRYNQGSDSLGGFTLGDVGLIDKIVDFGVTGVELDDQLIEQIQLVIDTANRRDSRWRAHAVTYGYVHRAH